MATKTILKKYINQLNKNPYNMSDIQFDKLIVDECLELVKVSGICLKNIPVVKRTKKVCVAAVDNNPLALEYVPKRFKTLEMCEIAYKKNEEVFPYLLPEMHTLELGIDCYQRLLSQKDISDSLVAISKALPKEFHENKRIISLERNLEIRKIVSKQYKNGRFIVVEEVIYQQEKLENYFEKFEEFYDFVDRDLKDAELLEYNFAGIKLKELDISEAYVNAEVLYDNNMYSDEFFCSNVKVPTGLTKLLTYEPKEVLDYNINMNMNTGLSDDTRRIFYISDIHLNQKLQMEFTERATENEVIYFIKNIVDRLVKSIAEYKREDFFVIAGDVSYNFKIVEIFYTLLVEKWKPERIVVVLGNHELWDYGSEKPTYSTEFIIEKYRMLFERLNIIFLHNDLMITIGNICSQVTIIKEKEILSNSVEWLREKCRNSRLTILGGIGFSGKNKEFNADNKIYGNTITSIEEDKKYTNEYKKVYDKVKESMGPLKIIILTHMPYADWTDEEPVPNWIYVNGHTHKNQFCIDDTKTVYADNQVGYSEKNVNLKYFYITKHYDIFVHYSDGIYEIKREEYIDFCRGLGIKIEFNRTNGQILMLKRDGIYCFLYRNNNEILYFLKGGDIRKLKHQNVQYFYDMMAIYKKAMEYVMNDYHNALKYISSQIKKIGGDGCIHGCIVDIDYFNHIYLNPANGEIKCYWALSIDYRQEYHNLEALLKDKRQDLYINYKQEFLENKNEMLIFKNNQLKYDSDMVRIVSDTSMYRPSNMLCSIQYMFDVNVIREWNEQTVERAIEKYLKGVTAIDATKKSPARISLSNSCAINRFGMEERMQDDSDISDYEGEIT